MDNLSEQKIEQTLQTLAEIHPGAEASRRVQENVQSLIADRCRSGAWLFLQRHKEPIVTIAAAALIVTGLLVLFRPVPPTPLPVGPQMHGSPALGPTSLGTLNKAFEDGGMEAVEKLFKEFMESKKPKPEIKSIDDAMNGQSEKEN